MSQCLIIFPEADHRPDVLDQPGDVDSDESPIEKEKHACQRSRRPAELSQPVGFRLFLQARNRHDPHRIPESRLTPCREFYSLYKIIHLFSG